MRRKQRRLRLVFAITFQVTAAFTTLQAIKAHSPSIVPTKAIRKDLCSKEFSYNVTITAEINGEAIAAVQIFPVENVAGDVLIKDSKCSTPLQAGEEVQVLVDRELEDLTQEGEVAVSVFSCDPHGEPQEGILLETRIVPCNFFCPPFAPGCPEGLPILANSVPLLSKAGLLALILMISVAAVKLLR